jgi:hypothetical protein
MKERCPMCGQLAEMIWVRAHYQCAACGQITVPCCNGETACPVEADPTRDQFTDRPIERVWSAKPARKGG